MDKLTKIFQSGEVLKAQDLNMVKDKVNELVDSSNSGGGSITVDSSLSLVSTNPVQNKVITEELNKKVEKIEGMGLSTNDFNNDYKSKIDYILSNFIIAEDLNVALSLSSISINSGAQSTSERSVNVKFIYSGSPTHYMLSENSSFTGATWIAFNSSVTFNLSNSEGTKTLYAKVKDTSGESSIKNASITYIPVISLSLTGLSLNDGAISTGELSVSVKFTYTGTPTHYMLSESSSFVGASWISFASPAQFSLSSGEGAKTVYAKIKNTSVESTVVSDSITYAPNAEVSLSSITINDGAESTLVQQVSIHFVCNGSPTHYKLSESSSFDDASWIAFSNPASFTLSTGYGDKTIYAKVKNANNESSVVSDSITYVPVTGDIDFVDNEFKRVMVSKFDTSGNGKISITEAEAVKNWGSEMLNNTVVTNMNELKYFKNASPTINNCFSGCTSLNSIEFPDNWVFKGSDLKGDTSLSRVILPANLVTIPNGVFEGCSALESIEFPATVTTLGVNTFLNSGLVNIVIPDTIHDIGNLGYNCSMLIFADLGSGVTNIGQSAFVGSPIQTLIIRAVSVPTAGYGILKDTTPEIYVPDESVAAYKSAMWWSSHAARIHPLSEYAG